MNKGIHLISACAVIFLMTSSFEKKTPEIVVCGDDKVLVIDRKASDKENVRIIWSWKVSDAKDLPKPYQKLLVPTDECKPVDGNKKILITSSGGGVVLVDRETKKSLFYAHSPMAHSAEVLPNNRVVIALSTHAQGNRLEVYDLNKPEKVIFKDSLYSGHGVVWNDKIKSLFALGFNELRRYSLQSWNTDSPSLKLEEKWKLPDDGGHDLVLISEKRLILTTTKSVWNFSIPDGKFTSFDLLSQVGGNVKSVNYKEADGSLVYTKGEISWWTHNIYLKNPDKTITIPDINIYKVRVNN
jgi:hypothetical protein